MLPACFFFTLFDIYPPSMRNETRAVAALGLGLLCGLLASGCSSGAHGAARPPYLAQSLAVDCKPGESSVVCCIKKWGPESCGFSAAEAAELLNGARVLHEATKREEDDASVEDDFANNANLPEWKQRCIRAYVDCQNEAWTGNCHDCLRYCEGQQEWPRNRCRERRN